MAAEVEAQGGQALAVQTDVRDEAQIEALAARTLERFGRIDVLINNAAMPKRRSVIALDPGEVEDVMRVNFFAPMRLTLALLPRMLAHGSGMIVNVSSVG